MRYHLTDIMHIVMRSPYRMLARERSALACIDQNVDHGEQCIDVLRQYPSTQIEQLEVIYSFKRSLCIFDEDVFTQMTSDCGWPGAVWASWLAILEPDRRYCQRLQQLCTVHPHQAWLLAAASRLCNVTPNDADTRVTALTTRLRVVLVSMVRPHVLLRTEPTPEQAKQMQHERRHLAALYRAGGAPALQAALPKTVVGYYAPDYPTWQRTQRSVTPWPRFYTAA